MTEESQAKLGIDPGNIRPLKSDDELKWIECPNCANSVSYLGISGDCLDCEDKFLGKYIENVKIKEIFHSEKALAEFSFEKFTVTPETKEAYDTCMAFQPEKDNLYLWGSCGSGKSHLAYSTVRQQVMAGLSASIYSPPELMRWFRGLKAQEEQALLEKLQSVPVLLIDDLGIGKATEFALTVLYEIVERRVMNYKNGLIITSNLSMEDLARKLDDDRFVSRLAGVCQQVKIEAPDWRLNRTGQSPPS